MGITIRHDDLHHASISLLYSTIKVVWAIYDESSQQHVAIGAGCRPIHPTLITRVLISQYPVS